MPEIKKCSLKNTLLDADIKFDHKTSVVGKSSMTFPGYINSTRTQMYTSHLNQFLNILYSEFPFVFTGAENTVGAHSTGYKKAKNDLKVIKKVAKYGDIIDTPYFYFLFVYNEKKKRYEVIERKEAEDLIEDFAYKYNNDVIDDLLEGDTVPKDTVLLKSSSYDKSMNYCFGINARVGYVLDPFTSEDAAEISDEFSERMSCVKETDREIGINANEVLLNIYGNGKEYKAIPEVGEYCESLIAATRPIYKDQVFFDMKDDMLRIVKDGDRTFFSGGPNAKVIDYDIYCNCDEIPDTPIMSQVKRYAESQNKYWKEIKKITTKIINSGKDYTQDIDYLHKRSKEFLDSVKKWQDSGDNTFGNIKIVAKTLRVSKLTVGGKFTGRFGNKSVVSRVIPKKEMPMTDTGEYLDVKLNLLAIINRTTAFVPHEIYITFILNRLREQLKTMDSIEDQETLMFSIIKEFNRTQEESMHSYYRKLSAKKKREYMDSCINDGIYIHQMPIWEDRPIFYILRDLTKKYDWLKPYKMFQLKGGQMMPTLTDMYIGTMYMIRLKQTGERGFSARNTGAINMKGLPERSYKNRTGTDFASDTPIRLGEFETITLNIGLSPEEISAFHALYRTSEKGRREIVENVFGKPFLKPSKWNTNVQVDNKYTSRVSEIFSVIFKSLGLAIEFKDSDNEIRPYDTTSISSHQYGGKMYLCTDYEFYKIQLRDNIRSKILDQYPVLSNEDLEAKIDEELKQSDILLQ